MVNRILEFRRLIFTNFVELIEKQNDSFMDENEKNTSDKKQF